MTTGLLMQLGIKGALILLAAWSVTAMMRRASAASRHLVWAIAIAITLAMPLVRVVGPSWNVVIPVETAAPAEGATSVPVVAAPSDEPAARIDSSSREEATVPASGSQPMRPWIANAAVALWAIVAALLLIRLAYGMWRTHVIARSATAITDPEWLMVYDEAAAALCVTSPVQLRQTVATKVPVACGLVRPAILLPIEADSWSRDRRLVVLLHELAHVRRRDCLMQTFARVTSALHWINPLAHVAVARLRAEQEHACDDLVLTAGAEAPAYADHLFDIARSFRSPGVPEWATLAMARPSQLEGRLTAILDDDCNRAPLARRLRIAIGMAAIVAIVGLGALQVSAAYVTVSKGDVTVKSAWLIPAPNRQAPPAAPAPPQVPNPGPTRNAPQAPRAAEPPAPPQPTRLPATVVQPLKPNPQVSDEVRGRVADALATALTDENESVRRHALNGLTQMRDQRAVPALMKALRDPSPDLRKAALQALSQFNAPEAYDAVILALRDENAEVRELAVSAAARAGRPAAVAALIPLLKDPVADVRERTASALGALADPAAIEALTTALKDPDADVREQAALALARIAQGPRKGRVSAIGIDIDIKRMEGQAKEMEKAIEVSFGKDFEKQIEQWGETFGENLGNLIEGSINGVFGTK